MRTFTVRSFLYLIVLFMLFSLTTFAQGSPTISATVQTNKPDYQPGDSVIVTGSNWQPGETVMLIFTHSTVTTGTDTLYATADSAGNIYNAQYLITSVHIDESFILTALGQTSGYSAQTTFTDAGPAFTVTGYSPSSGSTAGGTLVTISGSGFGPNASDYQITFGGIQGTNVIRVSSQALTVNSPAHAAGGVTIQVKEISTNTTKTVPGTYTYVVLTGTQLTVQPSSGTFGGTVNLSATLITTANAPIAGKTVNFSLNGVSVGTAVTNASGVATLNGVSISGISIGVHSGYIGASFAESVPYAASTAAPADLTVNPLATTLAVTNETGTYGGTVSPSATLTQTSNGSALSGQVVTFFINGTQVGQATTVGNGKATLHNVSISGINAGSYPGGITATFAGAGNFGTASGSGNLTVNQANSTLTVSNSTGTYNGTVNLTATLSSTNTLLSGMTITFSFNGNTYSATTNASGVASVSNVSLSGINAWTHNGFITASFAGTVNYAASSGSGNLTVNPAATALSVSNSTAIFGGTASLSATLTSAGSPLSGMTVNFTLNGTSVGSGTTDVNGIATVNNVSLSGVNAGTYTDVIGASFTATTNYLASSGTGNLTVNQAATALVVANASGPYGGTVNLTATLTSSGNALSGMTINFTINGSSVGSALTGANGVATLNNVSLSGINAGTYTGVIVASFSTTGNYLGSTGSGDLTVNAAATTLTVTNVTGTYGQTVNLSATLTSVGSPLSGMNVSFTFNGSTYNGITNASGVAEVNNVSLSGINAGSYSGFITADFSAAGNYASSTGQGNLTVNQAATSLSVANAEGYFGSTVTLTATLTSSANPLSGMSVNFTLNGLSVGSAVTDANGLATLSNVSLSGISAGTFNNYIGASYTATGNYASSSGSADLTVKQLATSLSVANVTGTFGGNVNLEATLTSSGNPLNGMTISFTFNGSTYSATTNASGIATVNNVSLSGINAGTYTGAITAGFTASGNYSGSTGSGDLTVKAAATTLTVSNATGTFGTTVNLSATLTSAGLPLSGMSVNFTLNGSSVGSGTTDVNGIAALNNVGLSGINAGTYNGAIGASFSSTGNYGSSLGSGNLTVNQAPTTLAVSNASGPYSGTVNLTATLTSSGNPLSGMSVNFTLNGLSVGSGTTDANGVAALNNVSLSGLSVGIYNNYIGASFSPAGGNYAASSGTGQLEVTLAPTSLSVANVQAVYGSSVTLSATLTSGNLPLSGKTVNFTLNQVSVGSGVTDANGVAALSNVSLSGISVGTYSGYIGAGFAESNPYKASSATGDLTITKSPTAILVSPASVQYSDQVTLTAIVTSATAQSSLNTTGGSVVLKYQLANETPTALATVTAFTTTGDGKLAFNYTFICNLAPNTYKILATFTPADAANFDGSSNLTPFGPLTVNAEDALADYTGLQYFSPASTTSITAKLTFSATITDMTDASRGDITNSKVEFREVPLGGTFATGIVRGTNLPVFLVDPADKTVGTATNQTFNRDLTQSEQNSYGTTFNVYTSVSGYYSKLSDPALITISIPGSDNVSGGGFVVSNSSAGQYRSKPGSKTNFGFTMKYNKTGKNIQGQANIIIRGADDKIYQIKSNAINTMSTYTIPNMPGKAANFNTKANLTDITNPANPISLGGSFSLTVEMYDDDKNSSNDAIGITLQDGNSGLLYSSSWNGTRTVTQQLTKPTGGGNIKVLSSSLAKGTGEEFIPKEYALFQNYPNPFNPSTTIQFDLPEDSRVSVVVYDILGKEVATLVNDNLSAGRQYSTWNSKDQYGSSAASGMYILRISARSINSENTFISTKKMMLLK